MLLALEDEARVVATVAFEVEARRSMLPVVEDEAGIVAAVAFEARALNLSRWVDDMLVVQYVFPTPAVSTLSTRVRTGFSAPLCLSTLCCRRSEFA